MRGSGGDPALQEGCLSPKGRARREPIEENGWGSSSVVLWEWPPFLLVPAAAVPRSSQGGPCSRALWALRSWCDCRQPAGVQACSSWVSSPRELTAARLVKWDALHVPRVFLLTSCSGEEKTRGLNLWASLWGRRRQLQGPWEQAGVTTWWRAGMHRAVRQSTSGRGRRGNLMSVSYPAPRAQHTWKSNSVLEVPISSFRCAWVLAEGCRLLRERDYKQAEIAGSPLELTSLGPRLKIRNFQHLN